MSNSLSSQADSLSEIRFTVICVKTLNDLQSNADVVEVVCVKIRGGHIAETLHMQFNPPNQVPEAFTRATGLYKNRLQNRQTLENALPELAAFVGRDVIIWANPPGKTNAVHRYFKLTQPKERQFFMASLSRKLMPELSRHHLPEWAHAFGLDADGFGRAEKMAIVSAKVFVNFLALLGRQGIESYSQLLDLCPTVPDRTHRTRNDLAFDRNRLKDYPTQPGVYFMKNRTGDILYVGKAKNLRNRLRSYFQKQSRLPSKIAAMMRQVAMIDVTVVGSELEALLLESRLIKQLQPFFNKKVKNYHRMVFMSVSVGEAFPRVSMSPDSDNPENAYFGPFQRPSALMEKLEVLNRVFRLRDCSDKEFNAHRQHPCMKFELGQCSGPCAGKITETDYRAQVADFLRFLAQEPCDAVDGLIARREAYTEALLFEKAAVMQDRLEQLERLRFTSQQLIQAVERQHCLIVLPDKEPGQRRLLSVIQGQPSQWKTIDPANLDWVELESWIQIELDAFHALEALPPQAIPKILYEESRLIGQWLSHRSDAEGTVIGLANKSARAILNELLLVTTPGFGPQLAYENEMEAAEEAWTWEQEQQA